MNNVVKGWKAFSNPRHFPEPYGRQKGWERIGSPDNEEEEFHDITEAEAEQLELLGDWLNKNSIPLSGRLPDRLSVWLPVRK